MRRAMILLLGLTLLAGACGGTSGATGEGRAVAAFYPLAWATERVAGDAVEVADLTPPGVEPHDLELSPRQVGEVTEAELLIYAGQGFQPAIEDLAEEKGDAAFDVLAGIELIEADEDEDEGNEAEDADHEGEAEGDDEHGHSGGDPHVWLDPLRMIGIVEAISTRITALAPDAGPAVEERTVDLVDDLRALHNDFDDGLESCERREIVVSHDAFGYLADRYDLEQISISGIDPEAEPSPGRIADVADLARDRGVTTIFFETLVSPAIAETIAAEIGVDTAVLDPLEGPPEDGDYLTVMRANLAALRSALGCR